MFVFIGVSGRTSLPQTVGPSNNMGPPLEALGKRESLSVSNRTRRSLEFNINDPEEQDIMSNMQFLKDDPINVHVDPPSTDDDSHEVKYIIYFLCFDSYCIHYIITIRMGKGRLHPARKIP